MSMTISTCSGRFRGCGTSRPLDADLPRGLDGVSEVLGETGDIDGGKLGGKVLPRLHGGDVCGMRCDKGEWEMAVSGCAVASWEGA